jgi:manganese/zinc/iron transport system permease protein
VRRRRLESKIQRQHLLRAIYERLEARGEAPPTDGGRSGVVPLEELVPLRSWSRRQLVAELHRAQSQELVHVEPNGHVWLTAAGCGEAARNVHDHRLWELYLIRYADVATSQVDRDADTIEHVLDAEMVAELEALMRRPPGAQAVPPSPHQMDQSAHSPATG